MKKTLVRPTGDLAVVNNPIPATLPVPLPIVFVHVDGPFTALDRKLWVLLLHHAWDELETKSLNHEWHEIHENELRRLIERLSGTKDVTKVWEASRRLTRTIVDYVEVDENQDIWDGVTVLFQAKKRQKDGLFRFKFPAELVPLIKAPGRFARLRVEFLLSLRSKYGVTLYELFETKANQRDPVFETSIEDLRRWLKVPEGKLKRWDDLFKKALAPALDEININNKEGGITAAHELLRGGRGGKVVGVKFFIQKTKSRIDFERALTLPAVAKHNAKGSGVLPNLRPSTFEKAKKKAPGLDIYSLEREWRDWAKEKDIAVKNPDAHFLSFCGSRYMKK